MKQNLCIKRNKIWQNNINTYKTLCAIWYHVHILKNLKNNHGGVLLLVKLR